MNDTSSHNHHPPEQKPKLSGTHSSGAVCDLCGLSLRHGHVSATIDGKAYHFCCNGCRQVFNILIEASDGSSPETFKHSELFKQCVEKGIIPKSEAELAQNQRKSPAKPVAESTADRQSENVLDLVLKVGNMWCPACAWLIDESLQKSAGIIDSACNFTTDRLQIRYDPVQTSPTHIIQSIARLGYKAAAPDDTQHAVERRKEFVRFAILFGKISKKLGTKKSIYISLLVYTLISIIGFLMSKEWHFILLGFAVATVQRRLRRALRIP